MGSHIDVASIADFAVSRPAVEDAVEAPVVTWRAAYGLLVNAKRSDGRL